MHRTDSYHPSPKLTAAVYRYILDSVPLKTFAAVAWGGTVQRTFVDGGGPPAHRGGGGGGGADGASSAVTEEPTLWSDILQQPLHDNTLQMVKQYRHGDETCPFNQFGFGKEVSQSGLLRSA